MAAVCLPQERDRSGNSVLTSGERQVWQQRVDVCCYFLFTVRVSVQCSTLCLCVCSTLCPCVCACVQHCVRVCVQCVVCSTLCLCVCSTLCPCVCACVQHVCLCSALSVTCVVSVCQNVQHCVRVSVLYSNSAQNNVVYKC